MKKCKLVFLKNVELWPHKNPCEGEDKTFYIYSLILLFLIFRFQENIIFPKILLLQNYENDISR